MDRDPRPPPLGDRWPPRDRLVAWALAAFLMVPSVSWVLRDRSVWMWDPADYGAAAVDLSFELRRGPVAWFEMMRTVLYAKAPGITWLGQLFVPFGRWNGSVEQGLLASVLLVQAATIALTFQVGRRIAPASVLPAAAGAIFIGSAPLFVTMSHHFMTEALQGFAVAYVYWVAVHGADSPPSRTLPHLVLAMAVALLAKFNTPAFVVFAAALAGYRAFAAIARQRGDVWAAARPRDLSWGAAAVVLVALGAFWYARNGKDTYRFAKLAASSDVALHYGRRAAVTEKLVFWAGSLRDAFLAPGIRWVVLAVAVLACWAIARRLRGRRGFDLGSGAGLVVAAAALQVVLLLAILSVTINEEMRFLLGLGPTLAILTVWSTSALRSRSAQLAVVLVLATQWGLVHASQLGLLGAAIPDYYLARPPAEEDSRIREVSRVVERTCASSEANRWVMTGVDLPWFNYKTLDLYSAKAQLERGFRCRYDYLGFAEKSVDAALARLSRRDVTFFLSLEPRSMPPQDGLKEVALPVLRRIEGDDDFARVPFESEAGVLVFRRLTPSRHPSSDD